MDWQAIESSRIAKAVGGTLLLSAGLSAAHLVGFTVLMGSAMVSNLRVAGLMFSDRPVLEITRPAARVMRAGLVISVCTGLLLVSPRVDASLANWIFTLKMALLVAAVGVHAVLGRVLRTSDATSPTIRIAGGFCIVLWIALALAGCAYILIE